MSFDSFFVYVNGLFNFFVGNRFVVKVLSFFFDFVS